MAGQIDWSYQERMSLLRQIASESRHKDPAAAVAAITEYNHMQETAARYPHLLLEPTVVIPGKPKAEVFSPATLAKHWGCSERHIRNMIEIGEIPAFRIGTLIRVRAVDASAYEHRTGIPAETVVEPMQSDADTEETPRKRKKRAPRLDTPAIRAKWKFQDKKGS